MHTRLLLTRWVMLNLAVLALTIPAVAVGWVDAVIKADTTGIVWVIAALGFVAVGRAGHRCWRIGQELDDPAAEYGKAAKFVDPFTLNLKLTARVRPIRALGSACVVLGLIGTVVGFIIALSGVDPSAAGDVTAVGRMVASLIEGMAIALYTTLVGAVVSMWVAANVGLVARGTVDLIAAIVEAQNGR